MDITKNSIGSHELYFERSVLTDFHRYDLVKDLTTGFYLVVVDHIVYTITRNRYFRLRRYPLFDFLREVHLMFGLSMEEIEL